MTEPDTFLRFGRYVVLRTLGCGGMGRVDLALDPSLEPPALRVLKTMNSDEPTPDAEARFRREAGIAMQLSHDAIARTHAVEKIEDEIFLVQEFIEGVDLAVLRRQSSPERLPVHVACYVASEIARALAYAHGKGVIHRDVTPNNVMLGYDGAVKLVDFGIAKSATDPKLTQLGVIVGREAYIAPEICAGEAADARADVYALGVVLWEALVGKRALDAIRGGEPIPDPSTVVPGLPDPLGPAVARALAPAPASRFQTMEQFRDGIGPFFSTHPSPRGDLVAFMSRHFQIDRERQYLAEDIEEAKRVAGGAAPALDTSPRSTPWFAVGAIAAAAIGAVAVAALRHGAAPVVTRAPVQIERSATSPDSLRSAAARIATTEPPADEPFAPALGHAPEPRSARSTSVQKTKERVRAVVPAASGPTAATTDMPKLLGDPQQEYNEAKAAFDRRDLAAALPLAERAVRSGGGSAARSLLGTIYLRLERYADAEREYAAVVKAEPQNPTALARLKQARAYAHNAAVATPANASSSP